MDSLTPVGLRTSRERPARTEQAGEGDWSGTLQQDMATFDTVNARA